MQRWTVRDAKNHLSRLIEAAEAEPQAITKRGRASVKALGHTCLVVAPALMWPGKRPTPVL